MKYILPILCLLLLTGCATPVQHNTPSGKVEISVKGQKKEILKDQITNVMMNKGYDITKESESVLSFDRPIHDTMARLLMSSDYDSHINSRVTFSFTQNKKNTRVVTDFAVITNPGSAFERINRMNNSRETADFQVWLNEIKKRLE